MMASLRKPHDNMGLKLGLMVLGEVFQFESGEIQNRISLSQRQTKEKARKANKFFL